MNAQIKEIEQRLKPNLKWQKVEEIPDFPLHSFADVKNRVSADEFSVGVDFDVARKFASWVYGRFYASLFALLWTVPLWVTVGTLILAFVRGNYFLLLCLPVVVMGYFLSSPYALGKKTFLPLFFTAAWLFAMWAGHDTFAWVTGVFILPIWINKYVTSSYQSRAVIVALSSEVIFLDLFYDGNLGIKNCKTGETHWYKPALLKKGYQMLGKTPPENIEQMDLTYDPENASSLVPDLEERLARIREKRRSEER